MYRGCPDRNQQTVINKQLQKRTQRVKYGEKLPVFGKGGLCLDKKKP